MNAANTHVGEDRRRDVIDAIASLTTCAGYPPSVREVGEAVGLRSTNTVMRHLRILVSGGLLTMAGARTMRLTDAGLDLARIYWPTDGAA